MLRLRKQTPLPDKIWTIPLPHGQRCIVDQENWVYLSNWKWHLRHSGTCWYVCRKKMISGKETIIKIHRQITHCPDNFEVHHVNGDPLDNRKVNLEIVDPTEHRHFKDFYRKGS